MQDRWGWILSLKPGDVVCTCSKQHKRIQSIREITACTGDAGLAVMCSLVLGVSFASWVERTLSARGHRVIHERIVTFGDGSTCTATACLDPVESCQHDPVTP